MTRMAGTAPLIPAVPGYGIMRFTAACDGTWLGPFTVLVAAGGARKESEWLDLREARMHPFPARRQQWRGAGDRPSRLKVRWRRTGAGSQSSAPGLKTADAGAVRQPPGREALEPGDRFPWRPARVSWSADALRGCRRGTRVPVAPAAVTPGRHGAWAERRQMRRAWPWVPDTRCARFGMTTFVCASPHMSSRHCCRDPATSERRSKLMDGTRGQAPG